MPLLLSHKPALAQFNLGCILIGSYINAMLYALEMMCVYLYYRSERSKRDPLFVKLAVAWSAVVDSVATFGVCGASFYLSVLRWGDFDYDFRTHWMSIMIFIANAFTEFIVEAFMVRRYFIMSRSYLVCAFIIILMLLSLEANLFLAISSAVGSLPSMDRPSNLTPYIVALASTLSCNLCTTIAMFWTMRKTNTYTNITHHLVSRISVIVVVTGTVTCIAVLGALVTFLAYPMSALTTTFTCFLGRVYSLTMLFTLLYRAMINDDPWIQVDDVRESVTALPPAIVRHGTDDNIRISSTPVSEMTFAHRDSLTRRNLEAQYHDKGASGSTRQSLYGGGV